MRTSDAILNWFSDSLVKEKNEVCRKQLCILIPFTLGIISCFFFFYKSISKDGILEDIFITEEGLPTVLLIVAVIYLNLYEDSILDRKITFINAFVGAEYQDNTPGRIKDDRINDIVLDLIKAKLNEEVNYKSLFKDENS